MDGFDFRQFPRYRDGWEIIVALFTRYGTRQLLLGTGVLVGLCAAVTVAAATVSWWFLTLTTPFLLVWVWLGWFFRDPDRRAPSGEGLFVSPADGRVSDITNLGADSELQREGVRIGIFMSIFNVHVNRSPCGGVVESVAHRDGAFLDARDPAAGERNESTTIRLRYNHNGQELPVVVRQIAGLIARRIVTDLTRGQHIECGQRIGMIKFGSRLELLVPRELLGDICVKIADHVKAGETVLVSAPRGCQDRSQVE